MKKLMFLIAVAILFTACNNNANTNNDKDTPNDSIEENTDSEGHKFSVTSFDATEFMITPQNKLSETSNSIYCVTLLYAWDEIRNIIGEDILVDETFNELFLLHNSDSYINVLNKDEYKIESEVNGDQIIAKAEFYKTLAFDPNLTEFTNKLNFKGEKVASFGSIGDNYDHSKSVNILYYKDDNNFIVRLLPSDEEHEIILYKTENRFNDLDAAIAELNDNIDFGVTDKLDHSDNYYMYEEDILVIPVFDFNIETIIHSLIGDSFFASQEYYISKAWQRIALFLNHEGAIIESEALIEVTEGCPMDDDEEIIIPKELIFDDEFLIIMRKVDSDNPYFAMWTKNAELMLKE